MSDDLLFLVLDDDADSRFLHRRDLLRAFPDAQVVECGTIKEALTVTENIRFSAVLSDHTLAGATGADFIAILRTAGHTFPIVLVTGNSNPRVREKAFAVGASHVCASVNRELVAFLRIALSYQVGNSATDGIER